MNNGQRTHLVDRLTEALIFSMQIPEGIQLVTTLGNGNESDNREAVKTWINQSIEALEEETGKALLPILQDRSSASLEQLYYKQKSGE